MLPFLKAEPIIMKYELDSSTNNIIPPGEEANKIAREIGQSLLKKNPPEAPGRGRSIHITHSETHRGVPSTRHGQEYHPIH